MTKIKLCGMRTEADILAANAVSPDYVGFILTSRFWRYVPPEKVKELRRVLAAGTKAVGVIVDEPLDYAAALLNEGVVDIIQLHGRESEDYIKALSALAPNKTIIKAFKLLSPADLAAAEASCADGLLLDSGTGSGQTFDWRLAAGAKRPFFLAGGLTPENVAAAIAQVHPYAVDVSSGIETDKRKDPAKILAFAKAVREAE